MPSPFCTNCSSVFTKLLHIEEGHFTHDNGFILPQCQFCARLWKIYELASLDTSSPVSVYYKFRLVTPDSGDLVVEITSDYVESISFRIIPSAGMVSQCAHLECQVNFMCAIDSGLRLALRGGTDTLCKESVSFLRSKLSECLATHTDCHHADPPKGSKYPTRLLNLKGRHRSKVTLEDTNEETEGHYFTLSHCWGGLQPVKLTRESEQSLRSGINICELPKTFREAIEFCRSLDIPYLWIDSMCIFQDDLTDWHAEAASMRQVYASASCNVAATGARDGSIGLRFEHDPRLSDPFELSAPKQFWLAGEEQAPIKYLVCTQDSFVRDILTAPLNFRAWVLQERFLSRRIMHFTASGVYWECRTDIANTLYREGLPDWMFGVAEFSGRDLLLLRGASADISHREQGWSNKAYEAWNLFCGHYSSMDMTNKDDKLVAIHGIAKQLSQMNGDRLICGLWEQRLIPQLLWYIPQTDHVASVFPLRWRAPSWSWASQNRWIRHAAHLSCGYGQERATVEMIEVDAHVSGQLKDASLTLRGKVAEAALDLQTTGRAFERSKTTAHLLWGEDATEVSAPFFDLVVNGTDTAEMFHEPVLCLAIYEDRCGVAKPIFGKDPLAWELGILILRQSQSDPSKYQRIGIFLLEGKDLDFYTAHESDEERSITII